jgi:hypothetical protein
METALGATVAALDRYEQAWPAVLAEPVTAGDLPAVDRRARVEDRLRGWDARLTAAAELSASVERQLDEPSAAVGRWQRMFDTWRELIQHGEGGETSERAE